MPQPPMLADQLQIEPGSAGSRLVRRAADGSLEFVDPSNAAGITLSQLAGLGSITNVLVVGKAGAGAAYTTIQAALSAVPSNASPTNPYLVLVLPGLYTEDLVFNRDGVQVVGVGRPVLRSALEATPNAVGNDNTITIEAGLGTTPQLVVLKGLRITNAHDGKACIRVVGAAASTLLGGGQGLYLEDCQLYANGAGGNRTLWATSANRVFARGCSFRGTNQTAFLCQEMSRVELRECEAYNQIDFRYDRVNDEPADTGGWLLVHNCVDLGVETALVPAVAIDCSGDGGSELQGCVMPPSSRLQYSGGQTHALRACTADVVSLLETVTVDAHGSRIGSLLAGNVNAALRTDTKYGAATLTAEATKAVVFDVPLRVGDTYSVALELSGRPVNDETPWITVKGVAGFTINFQTAQTLTATWRITRV